MNLTTMDVFSKLMMDRILFIGQGIDDHIASIITAQLLYLASEKVLDEAKDKKITIYINSGGGSIYSGNAILDVMDFIKAKGVIIETVNIGISASMAAVILSNGTKGHRRSLKRARTMIHQPLGGSGDGYSQATDMEINVKEIKTLKIALTETLAENSNHDYEKVTNDCERDYWLSAQETVDYGLVDSIV
jgi:ATP-dependent Clp protease protease subunit